MPARSHDVDCSGQRASGDSGRDLRVRVHGEGRGVSAGEDDPGRSEETITRDDDGGAGWAARWREAEDLRRHVEDFVAGESAAWLSHCDRAGGRSRGNGCGQVSVGFDSEGCGGSVEGDGGGSRESLPENFHDASDRTSCRQESHERAEIRRQAEDGAAAKRGAAAAARCAGEVAVGSCPVERTVGGLKQASVRVDAVRAVEVVQRGQHASSGDFENRAIAVCPACRYCPIEISVGGLNQLAVGVGTVSPVEVVQLGQRAPWGDLEDGAVAPGAADVGCPIKVSIAALNQPSVRDFPVNPVEPVQRRELATWSDLEDRAASLVRGLGTVGTGDAATGSFPVEIPVGSFNQRRVLRVPSRP